MFGICDLGRRIFDFFMIDTPSLQESAGEVKEESAPQSKRTFIHSKKSTLGLSVQEEH